MLKDLGSLHQTEFKLLQGWEDSLEDDQTFSRTRRYTKTTRLLRVLYNGIVKMIESWEAFAGGELQYFHDDDHPKLRMLWEGYLADIESDLIELRALRSVLLQKIEIFDNMRNRVW